jgi:phosphatidylcholine synthase
MPNGGAPGSRPDGGPAARLRAFSVHVFTACGAGAALLALVAATRGEWVAMFVWLGVALVIDGVDGTLARRFDVSGHLPRWSGDTLDFVVDFAAYVFVPAYAMVASGLLPAGLAVPLGIAVVVSAAIYFADRDMKLDGNYFRGFPALWNVAAFYLFVLKPAPWLGALFIAGLVVLTFAPIRFVHPLRVKALRIPNLIALALWAALGLYALVRGLEPGPFVQWALAAVAVYFLGVGFVRARE